MAESNGSTGTHGGVVYINKEDGLNRVMNNAKLYTKLLHKFKADNNVDELINTVEMGDYENARILAHTLKGITANLSLTELFKQSLDLEAQLKNKAVTSGSLQNIKSCFDNTITAIDMVIQQYG